MKYLPKRLLKKNLFDEIELRQKGTEIFHLMLKPKERIKTHKLVGATWALFGKRGKGVFLVDEEAHTLQEGEHLLIPKNTKRSFENPFDEIFEAYVFCTNQDHEIRWFHEE